MIETPERCHWCHSRVFIVNFGHILYLVLVFLLLTLNNIDLVSNIWSIFLIPMINFEALSIFTETKPGIVFTTGNMCSYRGIPSILSLFIPLGMWSIPSNLMSDIGVDCTLNDLHSNGVNLDTTEGRSSVFFALAKPFATFAWNVREGSCGSIHCVFLPYKNQALTTATVSEWKQRWIYHLLDRKVGL